MALSPGTEGPDRGQPDSIHGNPCWPCIRSATRDLSKQEIIALTGNEAWFFFFFFYPLCCTYGGLDNALIYACMTGRVKKKLN